MPVVDMEQARRARQEIARRGGTKRVRTVEIPGRPDLYATVHVTRDKGKRGGDTVVVVHRRRHRGNKTA